MVAKLKKAAAVIAITGASRGLGRGMAVGLARDGCSLALNYRSDSPSAEETRDLCLRAAPSPSQRFALFQADISRTEDRTRLVGEILDQLGRIDGLINNAGIAPRSRRDITEMSEASYEEVMTTNLKAPFFLTQQVVNYWLGRRMKSRLTDGFKIIFISSISSYTASVNRGEYCISKAGLSMAVELWALRLANEAIQVYEIRPGIMKTDMTKAVQEKYDPLIKEGLVPQRRWGTPDDVGRAVTALVNGSFPFSTGQVLDIDGGFHLREL